MGERVLILGGSGMLGHKVAQSLDSSEVYVTLHGRKKDVPWRELFPSAHVLENVDCANPDALADAVSMVQPDVVVNCVGIVKQLAAAQDAVRSITINSLLPHRLVVLASSAGARLIHISTDCVFSGAVGDYLESDVPDPRDLYGRSKLLGEVTGPGGLTIRTSIIGRELGSANGLVEWFLSNSGKEIEGYDRAVFSGLSTIELAKVIRKVIENHPDLSGLYHVSSAPISKKALLELLNASFHADVTIHPSSAVQIDRSLNSQSFRQISGWNPPEWRAMTEEMAADPTPYDLWR